MLTIGCHLSTSKGFTHMGKTAVSIGANTFAFFTRNPRGGNAKALDESDIAGLLSIIKQYDFKKLVAHAPYTMNLCSAQEKTRIFAQRCLIEDLNRMEHIPYQYYNFHPGSHVGQGVEIGIDYIVDGLLSALHSCQTTTVLLETMAGKGTEIGRSFEQLAAIIDGVERGNESLTGHLGVCLDTCHVFDAGYDIAHHLDDVLEEFDKVVGIKYLKAMHLNDSKNGCGSHKDRHACIGEGSLGIETFDRIVNHPSLRDLPCILETPQDLDGYAREIAMLRSIAQERD